MIPFLLALTLQAAPVPPAQSEPQAPAAPAAPSPDPAAVQFATPVGLVLVPVKAALVKDFEAAIAALQEAFQKNSDPTRRAMAQGWRVYRATEPDAKGNVLYIYAIVPVVPDVDYRPSLLLDELLAGAPPELLTKYRDALAGPPSKLSLTELAHMGTAPVKKD